MVGSGAAERKVLERRTRNSVKRSIEIGDYLEDWPLVKVVEKEMVREGLRL